MRRPLSTLLASLFLLSASASHAADPNNLKEAQRRFEEGQRLKNEHDYEHARLAFAQAAALVRTPSALYDEAYCEFYSGHNVDSLNHFRELLREPKAKPENVEAAKNTFIPQLVPKVGQITIEAPQGGAIDVDKEKIGLAPVPDPVAVEGGSTHRVIAVVRGDTLTKEIAVGRGETVHVILGNAPPATAAVASAGALDDIPARIEKPATMTVSSVDEQRDSTPGPERTSTQKWTALGLGVVAVGLAAGTVVMLVKAGDESSNVDRLRASTQDGACPVASSCAAIINGVNAHNTDLDWSHGLALGALGAGALAAVAWWAWPFEHKRDSHQAVVTPLLGPGVAGMNFTRSF
jgi:hypothetical protein